MKMKDIAARIRAHLRKFELDPLINAPNPKYGTRAYYHAGAIYCGGPRLSVQYISYQGAISLTKSEAINYLQWLDAGNIGPHWNIQP